MHTYYEINTVKFEINLVNYLMGYTSSRKGIVVITSTSIALERGPGAVLAWPTPTLT